MSTTAAPTRVPEGICTVVPDPPVARRRRPVRPSGPTVDPGRRR
ncbi:hypothetical protein [Cellulomonas sp. SLBN-39]|nr:hypothetical protein [Cellulomonas sp. SLBN-39]